MIRLLSRYIYPRTSLFIVHFEHFLYENITNMDVVSSVLWSFAVLAFVVTARNEVVAKVIFLRLFVILFTGGVSASVHAGILPPPPGSRHPPEQTPPWSRHPPPLEQTPTPRGPDAPWEQTPQADTPQKQTPRSDTPQEQTPTPLGTDTPPEHTPLKQTSPSSRHPPGADMPPPGIRLRHAVNERPVRILLECILVIQCKQTVKEMVLSIDIVLTIMTIMLMKFSTQDSKYNFSS